MSHFTGFVVLTPQYEKKHSLEDSLEKYDEGREVPEYSLGEVSNFEKARFIQYYLTKNGFDPKVFDDLAKQLVVQLIGEGKVVESESAVMYDNKEAYGKLFAEKHPELLAQFDHLYAEYGENWNGEQWRVNPVSGKWEEYSTYNPDSKWDYYVTGGRWDLGITTLDGDSTNECELGEIDWENTNMPFCLVVDGEWVEKGEMGWFGISINNKEQNDWNEQVHEILGKLPKDSSVTLVDFHI